jgi:methionyl-tRNA formyltransferase
MSPDEAGPPGFALLASGAHFSCAVLQALLRRHHRPRLLMLPHYPPAPKADSPAIEIDSGPAMPIQRIAADIETVYAPRARQAESAALIAQRGIEFLLVACWPYLIDGEFAASATGAALNLHPSLLPKYRGPEPLVQQLDARERRFGVTLHLLDGQFDHGDIVAQAELGDAGENTSLQELERRCAELGTLLFIDALRAWPQWNPLPQQASRKA